MQPEIDVLGLSVKTFGLMFALGFLASGAIIARRLVELGRSPDYAYEMVFAALIGGLVGARGYYLLQHVDQVKGDVVGSIFGGAGLVWYGGAIGGALCMLAWGYWRGLFGTLLLDLCAVPLAIGYGIGRIGCQISGDGDYGKNSDLPWAMPYPKGTVPTTADVQPTPIYETLAMGGLALVLWSLRDRVRPGVLFALYLAGAGLERFLVEFVRRNATGALGLTGAQWISLVMLGAGLAWLGVVRARHGGWGRPGAAPARPARVATA